MGLKPRLLLNAVSKAQGEATLALLPLRLARQCVEQIDRRERVY